MEDIIESDDLCGEMEASPIMIFEDCTFKENIYVDGNGNDPRIIMLINCNCKAIINSSDIRRYLLLENTTFTESDGFILI